MALERPKHPLHGYRNRDVPKGPDRFTYVIVDPHHTPDLNSQLGGGKIFLKDGQQCVRLTANQARFYVDAGSLKLASDVAKQQPAPARLSMTSPVPVDEHHDDQ